MLFGAAVINSTVVSGDTADGSGTAHNGVGAENDVACGISRQRTFMRKVAVEGSSARVAEDKFTLDALVCDIIGKSDIPDIADFDCTGIGNGPQIGIHFGGVGIACIHLGGSCAENESSVLTDHKVFIVDENKILFVNWFIVTVGPLAGFSVFVALGKVVEIQGAVVDGNGTAVDQTVGSVGNRSPVGHAGISTGCDSGHGSVNISALADNVACIVCGTGSIRFGSSNDFPVVSIVQIGITGNV